MALSRGDRLGLYEILAPLGAGGMGEVYLARDTKLDRNVAIKVLPEVLAQNAERLARFEREAKVLAALNHPHIAQIYGLEDRAIVMELVEGPTLADRLAAGPLPLEEALRIAAQIADALEAAHEKGIVHRDLKPANVKAPLEGPVKVLDLGLATALPGSDRESADPANSPTLTMGATEVGVILGTAAYMSPEQASGKRVDKRADIWSFGVVLWEMLTGRRLFEGGETVSHTLADVLRAPIDFTRLPAGTPAPIRELLERCLDRDVKTRLRDIGEARVAIARYLANPAAEAQRSAPAQARRASWLPWAMAAVVTAALGVVSFVHFREAPPEAAAVRFQIPAPEKTQYMGPAFLSPDGRRVAFPAQGADGQVMIWVRTLDSLEARAVPGTVGVGPPGGPAVYLIFWSPDSRFLGFFADGKLKKVDLVGGPPQTLCDARDYGGGTWNRDGAIVFANLGRGGLMRVSQAGGIPVPLPSTERRSFYVNPQFLSDGQHLIYSARGSKPEDAGVYVTTLEGKQSKLVMPGEIGVQYAPPAAPNEPAHLLYIRDGTLMARPVDSRSFTLGGDPFPVAETVRFFSVSANGALAYRTGLASNASQLEWFDREGKSMSVVVPSGHDNDVILSPDGRRVATRRRGSGESTDIWLVDAVRGIPSRFTFQGNNMGPVWSPDGSRVVFAGIREGVRNLFVKNSSGAGNEGALLPQATEPFPLSWSPDGRFLLYLERVNAAKSGNDLWVLPLEGDRKPFPYLQSPFNEDLGQFSPGATDGPRWVAYTSDESGRREVYVQSFPAGAGKYQISSGGGAMPRWRGDGKELFYMSLNNQLMAVDVKTTPKFESGVPKELFQTRMQGAGRLVIFNYDVAADGKRFLIQTPAAGTSTTSLPINVVLNWQAGLKK